MDTKRSPKSLSKKWFLLAASMAGVALTIVYLMQKPAGAGYPVAKATLAYGTVNEGALTVQVLGNGLLLPSTIAQVSSQSAGTVEQLIAKPGHRVQRGDLLLTMSNPALEQLAEELRWALTAQQAEFHALSVRLRNEQMDLQTSVVKSEAAYQAAKLQLEAEQRLIRDYGQVIADIDHQRSQLTAAQLDKTLAIERDRLNQFDQTLRAETEAAKAKLEQTRQQLRRAEQQVDALNVRSPIAGVVQTMSIEPGQRVDIGVTLAKVADPQSLYAELKIPEQQARDLALDQTAEIDTRNGRVAGRVSRIDPGVSNGMVRVDVELTGPLPNGARPDLSVDGRIEIAALNHALYVARPAFSNPHQQTQIYRLINEDQAVKTPVQYGIASVDVIEIKSGLKAGDRIVLNDTSLWGAPERLELN